MSKKDEYREFAASCLELAQSNPRSDEKVRLLAMAEGWLTLADRAKRPASRYARWLTEHPLIRKTFGFSGAEAE